MTTLKTAVHGRLVKPLTQYYDENTFELKIVTFSRLEVENLPCSKFVENEEVTLRGQFGYFLLIVTDKIKGRPSSTPPS